MPRWYDDVIPEEEATEMRKRHLVAKFAYRVQRLLACIEEEVRKLDAPAVQ